MRDAAGLRAPEFYNAFLSQANPVLISGLMRRQGWTALEKFRDLAWLKENHGGACVPVEIGRRSSDGAKGESRYMLLGDFITRYLSQQGGMGVGGVGIRGGEAGENYAGDVAGEGGDVGGDVEGCTTAGGKRKSSELPATAAGVVAYVSQHSLLHQEPGLQECFSVPEHTMGRLAAANAWLGTAGTVTHLHTDQADNLLCQVAGHKLVRMYHPDAAPYLYVENRWGRGCTS